MTERLITIANIFTFYELTGFIAIVTLSLLLAAIVTYWTTREIKISILFLTQTIVYIVIYAAFALLGEYYFESIRNGYQQIGLLTGLIIIYVNLIIYAIEHIRGKREKVYDPDRVNRKHFSATLNSVVIVFILGVSYGFFSPDQIGQVVLITSAASVLTLVINHLLFRRLYRDPRDQNK